MGSAASDPCFRYGAHSFPVKYYSAAAKVVDIIPGPHALAALRVRDRAQSLLPNLSVRQIAATADFEMKLVDVEAGEALATHIL